MLAPDEKNVQGKYKTAIKKQRAEIAVFIFFAQRFWAFCEINGFIVFCQPYKTPNGSKKQMETEKAVSENTVFGAFRSAFDMVW